MVHTSVIMFTQIHCHFIGTGINHLHVVAQMARMSSFVIILLEPPPVAALDITEIPH